METSSTNPKITKVGDQYFMTSVKDGAIRLVPVTQEAALAFVAESVVFLDQDPDNTEIQAVFRQARQEIVSEFKKQIKSVVLKSLGFTHDGPYNSWRISDNGNKASQHITIEVKQLLSQVDATMFTISDKEKEEMAKVVRKEMIARYKRELESQIYRQVESMVKEDIKTVVASVSKERSEVLCNKLLDTFLMPKKSKTKVEKKQTLHE